MNYAFETVDVFTATQFGGNPLAVFHEAEGISAEDMQALSGEMNLSETTFVLPPLDPKNTARVRIFNRTAEMAFAGHPCIGTAFVLSRRPPGSVDVMRFEVPAGIVVVELERLAGAVVGARLTAPQPLSLGREYDPAEIAVCVGLGPEDVLNQPHRPVQASMGNPYVIARVSAEALSKAEPDVSAFRAFRTKHASELGDRFSLHLYAGAGAQLRARMFAPLAGTVEDPATGSANAPLAGLLLSLGPSEHGTYAVTQGVEMGRPSTLHLTAMRSGSSITATVAGRCVPVLTGVASLAPSG